MPRANKGAFVWLGQGLGVAVAVLVQKGSNKQTLRQGWGRMPTILEVQTAISHHHPAVGEEGKHPVMKVIDGHRWDLLKPLLSATLMHHSHIQTVLALHLAAVQQTGWSQWYCLQLLLPPEAEQSSHRRTRQWAKHTDVWTPSSCFGQGRKICSSTLLQHPWPLLPLWFLLFSPPWNGSNESSMRWLGKHFKATELLN